MRNDILGGAATFVAMAYIIVVNPAILKAAGLQAGASTGAVFVSGVLFLIITVIGLRGWLAKSISQSLKFSFAAGIGLFLAFIGLTETGIVESGTGVPVKIGNLHNPQVLLAIGGFVLMMALMRLRMRGAILISIAVTAIAGILLGYGHAPRAV